MEMGFIEMALTTVGSIWAAAASAWLWARSARQAIQPVTSVIYAEEGPFAEAMKHQASLNSWAAACTSIAAACQGALILARVLGR
jgi:hypothetical protein